MSRLIDADVLREEVNSWGMNDYEPSDFTDAIDDAPTVEAIPKADYETRLKNDLAAMLTEIQLEIEEIEVAKENTEIKAGECCMKGACIDLIQQKIDKLRGNENGNDER